MRIGLCTISNTDWPIGDVIDLAADLGFDGIEVWGKEPHVGGASPEEMDAIRSDCAAAGLEIPVYGSYLRPGTGGYEAEWENELDAAEALEADLIRIWAGESEFGEYDEAEWEAAVEDLQHLSARADERGLGVTVEKHGGTLTNRAAGARQLIEDVGAENCGINWQPSFDLTAPEVLADLEALRSTVNNVHLQAVPEPAGYRPDRCPLSEAYFDVEAVVETLDSAGFSGYYEVEFVTPGEPYEEAVAADLAYLRSLEGA
ncbi:MAG: sugar phosphate isomerase/epimerase family protein [Halobacteriales archaeon]